MSTVPSPPVKPPQSTYGLLAEFSTPKGIYEAAKKVREAGYRWWDCHTPFPVHGLDTAMGVRPTILPILVFGGGLTGCLLGFLLQWFTNATSFDFWVLVPVRGYDFLISGKPLLSGPAYIPVMFELTILLSAGAAVGLMFLLNGLPQWYHPLLKNERFRQVTDDKFYLVIEARDPQFFESRTRSLLEEIGAEHVEAVEA